MTIKPSLLEDPFIEMASITRLLRMTDKWLYRLIQEGRFPKPTKFGRSSRWRKSEVEAWLQARIDASRGDNLASAMTSRLTAIAVKDTGVSLS